MTERLLQLWFRSEFVSPSPVQSNFSSQQDICNHPCEETHFKYRRSQSAARSHDLAKFRLTQWTTLLIGEAFRVSRRESRRSAARSAPFPSPRPPLSCHHRERELLTLERIFFFITIEASMMVQSPALTARQIDHSRRKLILHQDGRLLKL